YVIPGHLIYCLLWGAAAGTALQALALPWRFLFARKDPPSLDPLRKEGRTLLKIAATAVALALVLRAASLGLDRFTRSEQAQLLDLVSGEGGPPPALRVVRTVAVGKGEHVEVPLGKLQTLEPYLLVIRGRMDGGRLLARLILEENDTRDLVWLHQNTCCL